MRVCIGIVCIGQKYIREFEAIFKPSVEEYAKKHGYDLKIFTDFLDSKNTHPDCISFQKCLVPSMLNDYDCVIIMDADIYIHDYAPPIHTFVGEKIRIVNEVAQISGEQYLALGFASEPMEYYKLAGFHLNTNKILNSGVMVCNPALHSKFLENVYHKYIAKAPNHPRKFHYEQACIGYELQVESMFSLLENRWNYLFIYNKVLGIQFGSPYFLHFAGMGGIRNLELERYLSIQRAKGSIRWGIHK